MSVDPMSLSRYDARAAALLVLSLGVSIGRSCPTLTSFHLKAQKMDVRLPTMSAAVSTRQRTHGCISSEAALDEHQQFSNLPHNNVQRKHSCPGPHREFSAPHIVYALTVCDRPALAPRASRSRSLC